MTPGPGRRARAGAFVAPLLLIASGALLPPALGQETVDPSPPPVSDVYPIIASIRIEREDVFDLTHREDRHFPYTLANRLHVVTREAVIRRELLFTEGEPADPRVLYETERNLRRLGFIHPNCRVESRPRDDGRVDIVVHTRDSWTTRPEFSLRREGNRTTGRAGLHEGNLAGRGKNFEFTFKRDLDRTSDGLLYSDPRLLGTRWSLDASHFSRSDGLLYGFDLERPFFSLLTKAAGGVGGTHFSQVTTLRVDGHDAPGFRQVHTEALLHYGRALAAGYERAQRLDLSLSLKDDRFEVEPGEPPLAAVKPVGGADLIALPVDRRFRILGVEYLDQRVGFEKVNYLDRFDRYQDI
ncbi:MAG TPA: hypothetical protein VFT43_06565, partial [Candidatus Polarisedimenticolia bacterium]|nr:hypothetical protein [Candidatus Polarisedimenticolia bacterium]